MPSPAPVAAIADLLDANCPGTAWTPAQRRTLDARVRVRRLAAGATLFAQGDVAPAMYGVLAGQMDLRFSTEDGHGSVVERAGPPVLFALTSFVTGRPSTFEAVAVTPARLAVFSPPAYDWLMDEVPGFGRRLLAHFATRFDGTMRMLASSRHLGAEARLAQALRQLAQPEGPGWVVAATQQLLAEHAGLTRQTANECLAAWAAKGWIETGYRRLVVRRWPDGA